LKGTFWIFHGTLLDSCSGDGDSQICCQEDKNALKRRGDEEIVDVCPK